MKRVKKLLALTLALSMTAGLAACGGEGGSAAGESVYRQLYASEVETLNYLYTANTNDYQMCANMVDCLVEYDPYGVMQPALAESWEHNEDYTQWTFQIRQGVKWVNAQGEEVADVTAHDWVSSAKWVNDAANSSSNQYMYNGIVKNAQEYFNYTAYLLESENGAKTTDADGNPIEPVPEVSFDDVGVKAVDDYTLVYTMASPCTYFPSVLSYTTYMPVYGPFLEEQGDMFGVDNQSVLYNGAYIMSEFEPQNHRTLVKNPTYWDKDNVFIDKLEFRYNASATTLGPESFLRGEVDYAELDASLLSAWQNDPEKQNQLSASRPSVAFSYFFCFNFEPRFDASLDPDNWMLAVNNENFRQSIFHALDRVNALEVVEQTGPNCYTLRVRCSKGTYVRTLCHDIGAALGCGGCMSALRRTEAAGFSLAEAVPLEALLDAPDPAALLRPVDAYFFRYPAVTVEGTALRKAKNGNPFPCSAADGDWRVYGPGGEFLLLGRCAGGMMSTIKSFFEV